MKKTTYSEHDEQLALFLKALSHPTRVSIIRTLIHKSVCPHGSHPCRCGDSCEGKNCKCGCKCGELVELFPKSQSTVSRHIKELMNAGLIETDGRKGDYTLNHFKIEEGMKLLKSLIDQGVAMETEECCCCNNNKI